MLAQGDAGDGSEQDWTFKDDATAKAFVQLQRKRAAQARRREVHKALKVRRCRLVRSRSTLHRLREMYVGLWVHPWLHMLNCPAGLSLACRTQPPCWSIS